MKRVRDSFIGLGLARPTGQGGGLPKRRRWLGLPALALGYALAVLVLLLLGVEVDNYATLLTAFAGGFVGVFIKFLVDRRRDRDSP